MTTEKTALWNALEPKVAELAVTRPAEHIDPKMVFYASIAISLKRIADCISTTNEYGETGSQALAGAIYRGLKNG